MYCVDAWSRVSPWWPVACAVVAVGLVLWIYSLFSQADRKPADLALPFSILLATIVTEFFRRVIRRKKG